MMTALELPHVNVLSKYDMHGTNDMHAPWYTWSTSSQRNQRLRLRFRLRLWPSRRSLNEMDPYSTLDCVRCDLLPSRRSLNEFLEADATALASMLHRGTSPSFYRLNSSICELIDDWNMVQFLPLDPRDPDTIDIILAQVDNAIQYHDDVEPKIEDDKEEEKDDEECDPW